MKTFIIYLFLLTSIFAQQQTDSIYMSLSKFDGIERFRVLDKYIHDIEYKYPQKKLEYCKELIPLIKNLEIGDSTAAATYNTMGVCYSILGDYSSGKKVLEKGIELFKKNKMDLQLSGSYAIMATLLISEGNYELAYEYELKDLEIIEKLKKYQYKAEIFEKLASINAMLKNYDKAEEYYTKAEKYGIEYKNNPILAVIYTNWGDFYLDYKKYDEAYNCIDKALKIDTEANDELGVAYSTSSIARILKEKGELKLALPKFESALKLFTKHGFKLEQTILSRSLGEVYSEIHEFNKAEEYINMSLVFAKELNSNPEIEKAYLQLAILHEKKMNYKLALENFKKYSEFKDSTFNNLNLAKVNELQTKYESVEKEKENELLKVELNYKNEIQSYYLIIVLLVVLLIVLSLWWIRKISKTNSQLKDLNATKDKFFTIIAHDLKNPFSTLMGFSRMLEEDFLDNTEEENRTALQAIYNSSLGGYKLLENLLDWSKSQTGKIEFNPIKLDIKDVTDNILQLLNTNAKNKNILLKSNINESIYAVSDKDMIATTMRNITSNAIKFTNSGGQIEIDAKYAKEYVEISVKDNGVGIRSEDIDKLFRIDKHHSTQGTAAERGTGLGLIICKEFVEKNGGTISVQSTVGTGTEFKIKLPKVVQSNS